MILFSIQQYKSLLVFLVLFSLLGYQYLKGGVKQNFVPLERQVIRIDIEYKGVPALEVEKNVVTYVEERIKTIKGYNAIVSHSMRDNATIYFYLDPKYTGPVHEIVDEIRNSINSIPYFPSSLKDDTPPVVKRVSIFDDPFLYFVVYGDNVLDVLDGVDYLDEKIRKVRGVSTIDKVGYGDKEVWIKINPSKIREYGINLPDIKTALSKRNVNLSGGKITSENREYLIRTMGQYKNLEEIRNTTIVSNDNQNRVKVGDVAQVSWEMENLNIEGRYNGRPAVFMGIKKTSNSDILKVRASVMDIYKEVVKNPVFVNLGTDVVQDKSQLFYTRYTDLLSFFLVIILVGGALSVMYKGIAFGFWNLISFILMLGISFLFMRIFDVSLNLLTLYSLFIAGFVFSSISLRMSLDILPSSDKDISLEEFAVRVAKHFRIFFYTMMIFTGLTGILFVFKMDEIKIVRDIFYLVLACNISILFVNFVAIPSIFFHFKLNSTFLRSHFYIKQLNKLLPFYIKSVELFAKRPLVTVFWVILIFLGTFILMMHYTPKTLYPSDYDGLNVGISFPSHTPKEKMRTSMDLMSREITAALGRPLKPYATLGSLRALKDVDGQFRAYWGNVGFDSSNATDKDISKITKYMEENKSRFDYTFYKINRSYVYPELKKPSLRLRIFGDDLASLYEEKDNIVDTMSKMKGVEKVETLYGDLLDAIIFRVNNRLSTEFGVALSDITEVISGAFQGEKAVTSNGLASNDVDVIVKFDNNQTIFESREDLKKRLETLLVSNKKGVLIPITSVVSVNYTKDFPYIKRENRQRVMDFDAYLKDRDYFQLQKTMKELTPKLEELKAKYSHFLFIEDVNGAQYKELIFSTILYVVMSSFFIFFFLTALFRSYSQAFVIMLSLLFLSTGVFLSFFFNHFLGYLFQSARIAGDFNFFHFIIFLAFLTMAIRNVSTLTADIEEIRASDSALSIKDVMLKALYKRVGFLNFQFVYLLCLCVGGVLVSFLTYDRIVLGILFNVFWCVVFLYLHSIVYPSFYLVGYRLRERFGRDGVDDLDVDVIEGMRR